MENTIVIRGAREHNLQSVNVELPRNRLIVFTGVSGSGKSSLAFDTLYAEGQRRYVESLSSYARQFLGQLQKPDVDYLAGLSPAISIQQKAAGRSRPKRASRSSPASSPCRRERGFLCSLRSSAARRASTRIYLKTCSSAA